MVKIRLKAGGKKGYRTFRIVAIDSEKKRDGSVLESLGNYNPHTHPSTVVLDIVKIDSWLSKGAQMTERVQKLYKLAKEGKLK